MALYRHTGLYQKNIISGAGGMGAPNRYFHSCFRLTSSLPQIILYGFSCTKLGCPPLLTIRTVTLFFPDFNTPAGIR